MFLGRKKRQQLDRDSGLVFRWRGARSHHLGKFLALAIAVSLFGVGIFAVKLEGVRTPVVSQSSARVIFLDETSPLCHDIMMQVWDKSPFPPRWDPANDPETLSRIFTHQDTLSLPATDYRPTLAPFPAQTENTALPTTIDPDSALLPSRASHWANIAQDNTEPTNQTLLEKPQARIHLHAGPSLTPRLRSQELAVPEQLITEAWYGQTFRFLLTISPEGRVISGYSMPGGTLDEAQPGKAQKALLSWLKTQHFKPSNRSDTGRIELRIQATVSKP